MTFSRCFHIHHAASMTMAAAALILLLQMTTTTDAFSLSRGSNSRPAFGVLSTRQTTSSRSKVVLRLSEPSDPVATKEDSVALLEEPSPLDDETTVSAEAAAAAAEDESETEVSDDEAISILSQFPTIDQDQLPKDEYFMRAALDMAKLDTEEDDLVTPFPHPNVGAALVSADGVLLGLGGADCNTPAIIAALRSAGANAAPSPDAWILDWKDTTGLENQLQESTLYVTLEPSPERKGALTPTMTQLITQLGIKRVVIGVADPALDSPYQGAKTLQEAGVTVHVEQVLKEDCLSQIIPYTLVVHTKLQTMARKHYRQNNGQPLGFLHCSVVDSTNIEAFARNGNAFGTNVAGIKQTFSFRNFGAYEIAPPPEVVWADAPGVSEDGILGEVDEEDDDDMDIFSVDFENEDYQGDMSQGSPMMPFYSQADAVVATFPRDGNGPPDDNSLAARLKGLKWLATHGQAMPAGVERVLVMDATDLKDLPLTNGSPNLPANVDVETFWRGIVREEDGEDEALYRKPTRIVLRRGTQIEARASAQAAAAAAQEAAEAAQQAVAAMESGRADELAAAAAKCQVAAQSQVEYLAKELEVTKEVLKKLESLGVIVDTIEGGEPIDVMKHLGKQHGLKTVVWRAGCWGERGVKAILAGAFQWVSAHLAVDAVGGRFWQLMLAENAVQAACGPLRRVKIFADQEDISLEYCDQPDVDQDCILTLDGRPVRHVRLDCRVALIDPNRPREFVLNKTTSMK